MNSIASLLASGLSANKILDFFIRKSPQMGQKIQSLLAQGFTAEKILKFFSKGDNSNKVRNEIQSEYQTENNANPLVQAENVRTKNLGTDITSGFQRNVGPVLGTAAAGLTGYALSRAIPQIAQKIAPEIMQGPISPPTTSGAPIPEVQQQTQQQLPAQTIPQPQLKMPSDALWEKAQSGDINLDGKKDDFLLAVRGIRKNGGLQTKEEFDRFFEDYMANKDKYRGPALVNFLRNQFKQGSGKTESMKPEEKAPTTQPESTKEITPQKAKDLFNKLIEFDEPIYDKRFGKGFYRNTLLKMTEKERENWLNENADKFTQEDLQKFQSFYKNWPAEHTIENLQKIIGKEKQPEITSIQKASTAQPEHETVGNLALLPKGDVGTIESVKNGIAKVNIDGKITNRKLDDLEQEPQEIRDFDYKKMAQDYITSIPESERSRAMLMNYFVPRSEDKMTGEFHIIFPSDPYHMGIYQNVPGSLADKINSASTAPKTTGEDVLGKHVAGVADSRGAPMIELISNPEKYPYQKVPIPYNLSKRLYEAIKELNREHAKRKSEEKKALKQKEKESAQKKPKKPKK